LTVAILLALGAGGASSFGPRGPVGNQTDCVTVPSSSIFVDWAYGYSNLTEMRKSADRVVEGVVVGSYVSGCAILVTHYTVKVGMTIKGNSGTSLITVAQTGGLKGGSEQEIRDDPLMQIGDRVILFLRFAPQMGIYGILGGPQGRLVVTNHLVYSLNLLYPNRKIDFINWRINGLPETTILDQLRQS